MARSLLAALLALLPACGGGESAAAGSPNVLLVTFDTVRADRVSCYGHDRPTTPNLDGLAASGTRYERAWATAPWTVPTHASLFTGRFPFEHGAFSTEEDPAGGKDNFRPLHDENPTLAELFREAGYRTAAFVANRAYLSPRTGLDQGFETWEVGRRRANGLNEDALAWLADCDEPFFLFVNYLDAHRPYNTRPVPGLDVGDVPEESAPLVLELYERVMGSDGPAPDELVETLLAQYDLGIANADRGLGELLAALGAKGALDDTLIVVTSDHGEYFGEHRLVEHSKDVYEEALRVPLVVRAPGQVGGEVRTDPVSAADVPALIAPHLAPALAARFDDVFPYAPGNHPVLTENRFARARDLADPRWGDRFRRVRQAVYQDGWKYIDSSDGQSELYHLDVDPGELRNLATEEPERAAELAALLSAFQRRSRWVVSERAEMAPLTDEERRILEGLGYL